MPIPINRDIKQTLNALTPWFKDKLSCKELKLESLGSPETTGFSNETLNIKNTFKTLFSQILVGPRGRPITTGALLLFESNS